MMDFSYSSTQQSIVTSIENIMANFDSSSKVDIGDVSYGDSDGIAMLEIPYTCIPDAATNTEFDLIYT